MEFVVNPLENVAMGGCFDCGSFTCGCYGNNCGCQAECNLCNPFGCSADCGAFCGTAGCRFI